MRQTSVRRSQAPDDRRVHPAQAHLRQARRRRAGQVRRHQTAWARRPVHAREVREGPVRALQGQPELLRRASPPSTRSSCASSTTRTPWWPRSRRARSTPPRTSPYRVHRAQKNDRQHRDGRGLPGLHGRDRHQRRRRPEEAAPGPARPAGAPAIAHAIDQDTLVSARSRGHGQAGRDAQPLAQPEVDPGARPGDVLEFDLEKAKRSSRKPATRTPTATGFARCRRRPATELPYYGRSDSVDARPIAEFFTGWLKEIGIATTRKVARRPQLTEIIGKGDYDMFAWSWTPYVDPDTEFATSPATRSPRPGQPHRLLQRRQLLRSRLRQALRAAEGRAGRRQARGDRARDAEAPGAVGRLQHALHRPGVAGVRQGPLHRLGQQPAKTGPVLYSNTSPTYAQLKPVSASAGGGDDGGGGSGGMIAIIVLAPAGARHRRLCDHPAAERDERE